MAALFNLARMTVSSSGPGDITLNSAVSGYLTFDLAGCSTAAVGQSLSYAINDITASEIGTATYYSSALTMRGRTPNRSTNGNAAIAMSNAAQVFITPRAEDMYPITAGSTQFTAKSVIFGSSLGQFTGDTNLTYTSTGRFLGANGNPALTAFTGKIQLGLNVTGASSTTDFSGIDFSGTSGTVQARIAAVFSGAGSFLKFGTSNNYGTGITNTALTIDQVGNAGFAATVYAAGSSGFSQSTPAISGRGTGANNVEWGSQNGAGFGSNLGNYSGAGNPFIALAGEAGTNANTFRSRGIKTSIISPDLAGGIQFATVASSNADNQTATVTLNIDNTGSVFPQADNAVACGGAGNRWTAVYAVNGTIQTSDQRLKQNFTAISSALAVANSVDVGAFDLYDGKMENGVVVTGDFMGRSFGVLAQQLRDAVPGLTGAVYGDETKDILGIVESKVGVLALAAVKELSAKVAALEVRLSALST